jgi:hypothetical protein
MNDAAVATELIGPVIQLEILELIDFGAHGGFAPRMTGQNGDCI